MKVMKVTINQVVYFNKVLVAQSSCLINDFIVFFFLSLKSAISVLIK